MCQGSSGYFDIQQIRGFTVEWIKWNFNRFSAKMKYLRYKKNIFDCKITGKNVGHSLPMI